MQMWTTLDTIWWPEVELAVRMNIGPHPDTYEVVELAVTLDDVMNRKILILFHCCNEQENSHSFSLLQNLVHIA